MHKPYKDGYPINPQSVGEHIKKVRMDKGLFQKDVAEQLGVSEDCVTYWENGRSHPQVHYYPKIIAFLQYYPFTHEVSSWEGKLQQIRFCNGWTCKELADVLDCDPATIVRWEKRKTLVNGKRQSYIKQLLSELPHYVHQQHLSE